MKCDLDYGGTGISDGDISAMPGIFIRRTAAVEISSLLSVLRSNGFRCISIRRKDGGLKLFCDSYSDVDGIFEEEVTSALGIINCVPVMARDLKAERLLIVKSGCGMVYSRVNNEIKEEIENFYSLKVTKSF